jgi:hypothetical protein
VEVACHLYDLNSGHPEAGKGPASPTSEPREQSAARGEGPA